MIGHVLSDLKMLYNEAVYTNVDRILDLLYIFGHNVVFFSLLSGYLIIKSKYPVGTIQELGKTLINRYLRFSIPILATVLFNMIVGYCI